MKSRRSVRHPPVLPLSSLLLSAAAVLGLESAGAVGAQPLEYARQDPAKIETAESCGECHISELEVWKKTPHATGFKTLHRREAAEAIASKMGFLLVKRDSLCLKCHYTARVERDQLRAVSGVSCESCHGAGRDWINVHNDYGGKGVDYASEDPAHRRQRIERSKAAGMRRPSEIYEVAASCYGCHTVPEERLVNVGGHPAGSGDFELVAHSQGEIRHNFLDSFRTGDGTTNAERPPERIRRMYVVGRALELEYALRGVAAATEKGTYLSSMVRRVRSATNEMRAIARRAELPEVNDMLAVVREVKVGLGNRERLLAAAERIGAAARGFLERSDGTRLAALDPLVSGTAPDDEVLLADDGDGSDDGLADTPAAGDPPAGASDPAGAAVAPSAGAGIDPAGAATPASRPARQASQAVAAVGEVKTRIRPASRFKVIGPEQCTSCHRHSPQSEWWYGDAHFRSADPFFEQTPEVARIARFYGLRPDRVARGDQLCMDCHGTVVAGKERREVNDGTSCEGCHGPAADYVEPHQEGEPELGTARPGYVRALTLGMRELKDLSVRAETCTGCHYVTDPRLLSSGHPSGRDFDYVAGMAKINHWQDPPASAGALRAAFTAALGNRGAVPQVQLARAAGAPAAGEAPEASAVQGADAPGTVFRPSTPRPRPAAQRAPAGSRPAGPRQAGSRPARSAAEAAAAEADARALGLPPFPEIDPTTSVEELLLLLKERLELLYAKAGQRP